MASKKEYEYAEILVDKLLLESFANERSPYHSVDGHQISGRSFDKFRSRLKWHIRNSLSKRQKQVIEYYLAGKTEREIAHVLGITQQVVNIYKHRAIKKLHKVFAS
jgi:RNA polymerase sigma factor (sigma-70 family)